MCWMASIILAPTNHICAKFSSSRYYRQYLNSSNYLSLYLCCIIVSRRYAMIVQTLETIWEWSSCPGCCFPPGRIRHRSFTLVPNKTNPTMYTLCYLMLFTQSKFIRKMMASELHDLFCNCCAQKSHWLICGEYLFAIFRYYMRLHQTDKNRCKQITKIVKM